MGRGRPKIIKKERIPIEERGEMIGLRLAGWSFRKIAEKYGRNKSGIEELLKKKKKTGSVADILKKPRHRVTTKRTDRLIVRKSEQNRRLTAVDISKQVIPDDKKKISPSTVKRRL